MIVIEMREAAYDKAFELLDEIKELGKKKRSIICELEEAMYECYEASKDDDESEESKSDMEFRRRSGMRHYDEDDYMHGYRSSRDMRMRGNRSGRYSY